VVHRPEAYLSSGASSTAVPRLIPHRFVASLSKARNRHLRIPPTPSPATSSHVPLSELTRASLLGPSLSLPQSHLLAPKLVSSPSDSRHFDEGGAFAAARRTASLPNASQQRALALSVLKIVSSGKSVLSLRPKTISNATPPATHSPPRVKITSRLAPPDQRRNRSVTEAAYPLHSHPQPISSQRHASHPHRSYSPHKYPTSARIGVLDAPANSGLKSESRKVRLKQTCTCKTHTPSRPEA